MNRRVIFMGTPEFAVASLNALVEAAMEVVAVVTAPDRPAGRGRQLRMSAVKERAVELGLPVLQPTNLKDPGFLDALDQLDASLYVVVAFRMLPEAVWRKPVRGTINLHASLLPDYRGAAPINWVLINGETRTGVTTFFINDKIDTGDILMREVVEITPDDNAGTLHDRLMTTGAELLATTIKGLLDGTAKSKAQEQFIADHLHDAPKLNPDNCRIDWTRDAQQVHDLVRGLSPYPGAWTQWMEDGRPPRKLKILATKCVDRDGRHADAGCTAMQGGRMHVRCRTGMVEVLELQMEGKRPMATDAFLRGIQHAGPITLA